MSVYVSYFYFYLLPSTIHTKATVTSMTRRTLFMKQQIKAGFIELLPQVVALPILLAYSDAYFSILCDRKLYCEFRVVKKEIWSLFLAFASELVAFDTIGVGSG